MRKKCSMIEKKLSASKVWQIGGLTLIICKNFRSLFRTIYSNRRRSKQFLKQNSLLTCYWRCQSDLINSNKYLGFRILQEQVRKNIYLCSQISFLICHLIYWVSKAEVHKKCMLHTISLTSDKKIVSIMQTFSIHEFLSKSNLIPSFILLDLECHFLKARELVM